MTLESKKNETWESKGEKILLKYLDTLNEIKPCPRIKLLDLASNQDNLGRWLYWLIDTDHLVREERVEKHLHYFKTQEGEDLHWIMKRHEVVLRLKHYSGKRLPPTFLRHHPPPPPEKQNDTNMKSHAQLR